MHTTIDLPKNFHTYKNRYINHLLKWNKVHNLTGAKNKEEIERFVEDALYPLAFITPPKSLMDIGTGAGFPGMVLALAMPQTEVTLVEPLTKRASFLQFVKADLSLENVTVVKQRVEDMPPHIFDLITSRAVTNTKMLLQLSKNHRNSHTKILFYKGERVFDELEELPEGMQYKVIQTHNRHYLLLGENL